MLKIIVITKNLWYDYWQRRVKKIVILLNFINKIKDFYTRLTSPVEFDLCEEYQDILEKKEEIEKKNLLVGTIRRKEQLQQNLDSNFYHIPLEELVDERGIEFVALYQSKNLFSQASCGTGIHYYGTVSETNRVKRHDITEIPTSHADNRIYVRFDLKEWKRLDVPVKVGSTFPKVYLRTSMYLFQNARSINDMTFNSVDEYVVHLGIRDLINDEYDGFTIKDFHARRFFGFMKFKSRRGKYKVSVKYFRRNSKECLEKIFELI